MNARRRNTIIDLTSLLDVILILLFLILMSASESVEAVKVEAAAEQAQIERLTADNERLTADKDKLQRDLEGYVYLDAHARLINVFVENGTGGNREVRIENGDDIRAFSLTWQNASVVRNAVSKALTNMCSEQTEAEGDHIVYLLFRYDRNRIYQADYALLSGVIAGVKGSNEKVFSAEYDVLEGEKNEREE